MKKLFKSKKALSPVVAAIILIAVTVAVSIAVAAWMGALTFGFMSGSEQVKIVSVQFAGTTNKTITVTVQNTGTSTVVITSTKVNDQVIDITDVSLDAGSQTSITFSYTWSPGTSYNVGVITKAGNTFTYYATAPSS